MRNDNLIIMTQRLPGILLGVVLCLWLSHYALAGVEIREFTQADQEQRYHHLIDELRCLVCQNQNLADSNSQLAMDLRDRIYSMIREGKSDAEILDYMVQRYGQFVLYNPPLDPVTAVLWGGPFAVLLIAIFFLLFFISRRARQQSVTLDEEQRRRSRQLLDEDDPA